MLKLHAINKLNIVLNIFSQLSYSPVYLKFKNINDRFGHQTGDDILTKVSRLVLDNVNKKDLIGRYGGDEFIIILPDTDSEEALYIAENIRNKIFNEKILGDKADVIISLGIATYPIHGLTVEELIGKADQALYEAKDSGGNKSIIWEKKFINKVSTKNILDGIITGNTVQDSRNILAIAELIQLTNKNIKTKEKLYLFLGRMIEIIDAQFGYLLLIDNDKITEQFGRESLKEEWSKEFRYNKNIVKSVIESKQGIYLIDWDDIGKNDLITGLPDWDSILAVPIIVHNEIKGIIYFTISTRIKEFGIKEFNFINLLSDLISAIL